MAQNDPKKAVIRVTFTSEDKALYDSALRIAKKHGIKSMGSFGRMAITNYVTQINEKKVIL